MIGIAALAVVASVGLFAAAVCAPFWDRLFSVIWTDPTEREREEVRSRLLELHVKTGLPPAAATMLATQEFHAKDEDQLLTAAQLLGTAGIKRLASGQKSIWDFGFGLTNALRRGKWR